MPKLEMTNSDDFLEHWGTEGMHWGERRYQNYDGSLTEEGRRHYGIGRPRMTKAEKLNLKKKKQQEKNLKKARDAKKKMAKKEQKAAKDAENLLKKKQKIFERGDANEIYKNRKLFTTEEYQKAVQRAEMFSKSKPQQQEKQQKVDDGKMHSFQLSVGKSTSSTADRKKQAIINSGDPKLVKKNLSKLNDQELRSAIEHIKGMQELNKNIPNKKSLNDLLKAQKDRETTKGGKDVVDRLIGAGQTAGKIGAAAVSAYTGYNQFASMVNEITGEKKFPVYKQNPWQQDNKKSEYGIVTKFTANGKSQTVAKGLDASGPLQDVGHWNEDLSDIFPSSNSWTNSTAATFANAFYDASSTPISSIDWMNDFDA